MSKKKAKAKKQKNEKERSPTARRQGHVKHRDDHRSPGDPRDRHADEHVIRGKRKDESQSSSEHPKKDKHQKSDGSNKQQSSKGSRSSQDSCYRVKQSSSGHHVPSAGKSSSSHTRSKHDRKHGHLSRELQTKSQSKWRSGPPEPKQRAPGPDLSSTEKSSRTGKRRSSTDKDHPELKRRRTEEQLDYAVVHQRCEKLSEQRKKLVERRSKQAFLEEKCFRGKTESSCSREASSSDKNQGSPVTPKTTQHVHPKEQGSEGRRCLSDSICPLTSGEKQSPRPSLPLTFRIPKKSSVLQTRTNADVWESVETPAVSRKTPVAVSGTVDSSTTHGAPDQNTPRPKALIPQICKPFPKAQTQLGPSSPARDSDCPSSTPTRPVACQGPSTESTQTHDNDQEMQLVEELHLARSDRRLQVNVVESYGELTCMDVDPPEESSTLSLSEEQHQREVLIVLDTNILLSHLDFVKKTQSRGLGALGFPTLLVPWVVLQELDALKSGKLSEEVACKARRPVRYICSCLKNQEPRLWGQSMQQASQISLGPAVMNNDDRVLQCCLQYQELYPQSSVILCTDDKNLCSKSLLSGIKALTKADLVEEASADPGVLKRRCGPHVVRLSAGRNGEGSGYPSRGWTPSGEAHCSFVLMNAEPRRRQEEQKEEEEDIGRRRAGPGLELRAVLENSLQRALTAVLEEEMKAAYGDLWLEVVYLKPPWSLEAVLKCIQKHWIAVFGSIIHRKLLSSVETLISCLCSGESGECESVPTALREAEKLLMAFSNRSQYSGHVISALSCLQNIQHKLLDQPQKSPVEDMSDEDTLMAEAVEDVAQSPQVSHQEVWAFFESLWNNTCRISSAVFSALHHSPGSAEAGQPVSITPPQDALTCLHRLSAVIRQLLEAFQRILSVTSSVEDAQALLTVIHSNKIAAVEPQFTAKDLYSCLSHPEYREKLCVGGAQLMELRTNLDQCAAAVCGQSGSTT